MGFTAKELRSLALLLDDLAAARASGIVPDCDDVTMIVNGKSTSVSTETQEVTVDL